MIRRPVVLSPLDRGFSGLYNLDFDAAQKDFSTWQTLHPDDPMGPVSEAAGFLFSEFNRLGVLESQFYENDSAFDKRPKLAPDPALRVRFEAALNRTENLAQARLAKDSKDRDALFASTLASGLQADYAALIEKRNLASLHYTKEASASAQELLTSATTVTTPCLLLGSANTSSEAWRLQCVGFCDGRLAGGQTGWHCRSEDDRRAWALPRALCANPVAIAYVREKNKSRRFSCLLDCAVNFPETRSFPARSLACKHRNSHSACAIQQACLAVRSSEIHPFVTVL